MVLVLTVSQFPFVIAIRNLQFNKTLCSVTCINCQFCVTLVQFNHSAYNWEQIKFHLHDNVSLNVQLLQKETFETFSKHLPSFTNLETLAKQLADQLSGLDPRRWFQSITHSIRSGTVTLVIVLIIILLFIIAFLYGWLILTKLIWSGPFLLI